MITRLLQQLIRIPSENNGKNGVEKAAMKYYKIHAVNDSIVMSFLHSVRGRINWIGQVRGRNDDLYLKFKEKIMPLNVL